MSDGEGEAAHTAGIVGDLAVIRNGVDTRQWGAEAGHRREARLQLNLSDRSPIAVCVGRLSHQKGQDRLLRAWPLVRASAPDAILVLVGEGPERETLTQLAGPGTVFAGPGNVATHLAAADLFVLPSRWEGLSLACLEALAAGRPVVTTAVSGSEVVTPDVGQIVPGDPHDDATVVRGLIEAVLPRLQNRDRADEEGARAAVLAAREFDSSVTHDKVAQLTLEVLVASGDAGHPRAR